MDKMKFCITEDRKDFGPDIEVTLDEFCNPGLGSDVLNDRNQDQVLTRYDRKKLPDWSYSRVCRFITVSQLWCWIIGDQMILTCGETIDELLSGIGSRVQINGYEVDQRINIRLRLRLSQVVGSLERPEFPDGPYNVALNRSRSIMGGFSREIVTVAEDVNHYTTGNNFNNINIDKKMQFMHEINDIREKIGMMQTVLFQQEKVWKEFA
ncbi:hypothetical protein F5Y16DRAFT_153197 [Xylariaceae sp. FL0255]|nr:hypothetical protein F5Y16DRAFT_153197 [Xylariaceae sp. FL0255]